MRGWRRALPGAAGAHAGVRGDRRGDRGEVADARCCCESGIGAQKAAGAMVSRIRRRVVTVAPGEVGNGAGRWMGRLDAEVGETRAPRLREEGDLADSYLKGCGDRESTLFCGNISQIKISGCPLVPAPRFSPTARLNLRSVLPGCVI